MSRLPGTLGPFLVEAHRHAWRADAPLLEVELGELIQLLPNLVRSGSVGLVWPRLRHRAEEYGAVGIALEEAFRSQAAHNALVEREIARVVSRLQEAGVDPVLIKGYAVARLYPVGLIRTAGDIDLVVRDGDYVAAQEALADVQLSFHGDVERRRAYAAEARFAGANPDHTVDIDLHSLSNWYGAEDEDFLADARVVPLAGTEIRVPRVEDHLRALCLHFLRDGAVRPLRLCDIALLIETGPADFDWDRLLRGNRAKTIMITITLQLARELLGADLDGAPQAVLSHRLPSWLVPAVIREWEAERALPRPIWQEIDGELRNIIPALRTRWPGPISATYRTGAAFNEVPRLPIQLAACGQSLGRRAIGALRQRMDSRTRA